MKQITLYSHSELRDWREWWLSALVAALIIALVLLGLNIADATHSRAVTKEFEGVLEDLREKGDENFTSADDEEIYSMEYILIQCPIGVNRQEGKSRWLLEDGSEEAEKAAEDPYAYIHHKILLQRSPEEKIGPGSITKLMMILVALENPYTMDSKVYLTGDMFYAFWNEGASIAGFDPGDSPTFKDLIEGAMLTPGAECASALAIETAGNEEAFVSLMNKKAFEIGMTNTHFSNVYGLDYSDHYTCVSDMALFLDYALKNKEFYAVFTKWFYQTTPVYSATSGIMFQNTVYQKAGFSPKYENGEILGAKAGTSEQSAQCIVAAFEVDGVRFIFASAGGQPGFSPTDTTQVDDLLTVFKATEKKE